MRDDLKRHDIHIKHESYKLEVLGRLFFNMISELGLARGFGFETFFCNLFPIC